MNFENRETSDRPEIEFTADVRARELHFEEVPNPVVRFPGDSARRSDWLSERENLPERVEGDVIYRDARVRLLIADETTDEGLGPPGGLERAGRKHAHSVRDERRQSKNQEQRGEK